MKKQKHIPFKKPFWVLLSSCVVALVAVYGGIVWATATFSDAKNCEENRTHCMKLGVKNALFTDNRTADIRTTDEITDAKKQLRLTNTNTDKEYFVPLKSERERIYKRHAEFISASHQVKNFLF